MNVYLAPDSPTLTAWASLILGVGICSLCCVLQPIAACVSKRLDSRLLLKLIFEDLFYAAADFGAINLWRGPWLLCNLYILPQDMYAASNALTAAVAVVLMLLTRAFSSLPVRGHPLDGSLVDGEGAWLPNGYFRVLLHRETPNELDLASPMPYGGKCNDIKLISITKLMDDVAGQSESAQ
ncbi:PREDICTED: uncharacterized protein LOC106820140 [Priapulus caudatus]|uniref:Uncharacterized protein LOC106820140 n=1 Tax=Priapulus caudatus TaxID=37621 RepID=A0ABM1F6V2_PRICU|nr:PREDICTED: uncharacterized protein LOC106820140 [Priapulus caudatus]